MFKVDERKLYDLNQLVKKNPYIFRFEDSHFVTDDGQSDFEVFCPSFSLEDPTGKSKAFIVEDGKKFYTFLAASKKIKEEDLYFDEKGFYKSDNRFPVTFMSSLPTPLIEDLPANKLKLLDAKNCKLFYENEMLADGNLLISNILDVLDFKKSSTGNEFVFLEIIDKSIMLYEDKTSLELKGKILIALNNFIKLKEIKNDTSEFLHLHTSSGRLYIHYGNKTIDIIHKFYLHDFN